MAEKTRAQEPAREQVEAQVSGEARWPMAGAVVAAIVLTMLLPKELRLGPAWLLPLIEGVLLVAVIAGVPQSAAKGRGLMELSRIGSAFTSQPTSARLSSSRSSRLAGAKTALRDRHSGGRRRRR
jgi:hypothetical protein